MMKWLFQDPRNVAVFTTRSIVKNDSWIAHVSHDADDGAWQFHDNTPSESNPDNAMVVSLQSMVARDPTLNQLTDLPLGWRAWRTNPTAPWERGRVC